MSKFTSGFETLHLPRGNLRGSKTQIRTKSNMFDSKTSTLSGSTRNLVEKFARQAGLSRRQMRKLGEMSSKDYKPVKPIVKKVSRSSKRLTLSNRPLRRPRPVVEERIKEARDDLRKTSLKARNMAERREKHKLESQRSYLRELRVGHRYFDRMKASSETPKAVKFDEQKEKKGKEPDLSEMFMRITNEINEREEFMTQMRELKSLSHDRELQLRGEISERIVELEMLDRLIQQKKKSQLK